MNWFRKNQPEFKVAANVPLIVMPPKNRVTQVYVRIDDDVTEELYGHDLSWSVEYPNGALIVWDDDTKVGLFKIYQYAVAGARLRDPEEEEDQNSDNMVH